MIKSVLFLVSVLVLLADLPGDLLGDVDAVLLGDVLTDLVVNGHGHL